MTEKEIIDYLGRTSLPTLLVEGEDDAIIYRWLEEQLGIFSGSVLFCSGRDVLLSIYRKRATFSHGKIAWLADVDMWKFTSIPADLQGIIFTTGYSIENDLYAGSQIAALLEESEKSRHSRLLGVVCRWFAFEISEFLAGRDPQVGHQLRRVVDFTIMDICPRFAAFRGYSEPPVSLVNAVLDDYPLQLRGHTLMQALIAHLSDSRRTPKYSYPAIVEMCLKLYPNNPYIKRLISEANRQLLI
jgi:hypothetical protein